MNKILNQGYNVLKLVIGQFGVRKGRDHTEKKRNLEITLSLSEA